MKLKTQKGFTLIELMVVIVIIGILAAVAIPKMFGMSAKAKASEVGPSIAGWERVQAAYVLETSLVGGDSLIGFTEPTSKTFSWMGSIGSNATATAGAKSASNSIKLGDCAKGAVWTSSLQADNGGDAVRTDPTGAACLALTPSFK